MGAHQDPCVRRLRVAPGERGDRRRATGSGIAATVDVDGAASTSTPPSTTAPPTSTTAPSTTPPSTTSPPAPPSSTRSRPRRPRRLRLSPAVRSRRRRFRRVPPTRRSHAGRDGALWWRQLTASWLVDVAVVRRRRDRRRPPRWPRAPPGSRCSSRGTDNGLYRRRYDGTRWSGWSGFGGWSRATRSPPPTDPTGVYVFVRGGDGGLYWGKFGPTTPGRGVAAAAAGAQVGNAASPRIRAACTCSCVGTDGAALCAAVSTTSPAAGSRLGGGAPFGLTRRRRLAGADGLRPRRATALVPAAGPRRRRLARLAEPRRRYMVSAPAVIGIGPTSRLFVRGGRQPLYVQTISQRRAARAWHRSAASITAHPAATSDTRASVFGAVWTALLYRGGTKARGRVGALPCRASVRTRPWLRREITRRRPRPRPVSASTRARRRRRRAMATWRLFSPFTSVGIYIGGSTARAGTARSIRRAG